MLDTSMDREELALRLLVLSAQAGDERAFERLFRQFGARTLRYLRGLVGDAADDVQQEVWLTVYRRLADLGAPQAFRTWLFRTTRHRAIDFLRRSRREAELVADVDVEAVDVRVATADSHAGAEEMVWDELPSLRAVHREVLLLGSAYPSAGASASASASGCVTLSIGGATGAGNCGTVPDGRSSALLLLLGASLLRLGRRHMTARSG